ncbi:MAG: class I SAM-dependent methyltransferase [Rhodobacteraceae bacterium]|nr:MAG: class I SAM-dependent methyltransferase [Paracoccaceae bacterium]
MATDRHRKFWDRIAERYAARPLKDVPAYEAMLTATAARLTTTDRVLELGCGTGGTGIRLAPGVAEWIATDFSPEMIRIASAKPGAERVSFRVAEARDALRDAPFDAICAFNLLHLVDDMPTLLHDIAASLRPGGVLICKVWCFAEIRTSLRLFFRILRVLGLFPATQMLGRAEVLQALDQAGLELVADEIFGAYAQNPYLVARRPLSH